MHSFPIVLPRDKRATVVESADKSANSAAAEAGNGCEVFRGVARTALTLRGPSEAVSFEARPPEAVSDDF